MMNAILMGKPDAGNRYVSPASRYKNRSKRLRCLAAVLVCAAVACVAHGEAPIVEFAGYVNGCMNIWATNAVAPAARVVQMKTAGADDAAYADVSFATATYRDNKQNAFDCYYLKTNWAGYATFRIGNVSGDTRTYAEVGTFAISACVIPVTSTGYSAEITHKATFAFDGLVHTDYDTSSKPNLGAITNDMGTTRTIRSVRFVHKRFAAGVGDRVKNGKLYASDTGDFTGEETLVCTFPATTLPEGNRHVQEISLDTPVTARYFLYKAPDGSYGSIAELEFVSEDLSFAQPAVDISYTDLTNLHPIVSATPAPVVSATQSVIQRADSAEGPFVDVGGWTTGAGPAVYTNAEDRVGRIRYYRLRSVCGLEPYTGKSAYGPAVLAVRARRLDRSWTDETKLLAGVSVMDPGSKMTWEAKYSFDGNTATFADANGSLASLRGKNPAIGLDFGSACVHVMGMRLYPRPDSHATVDLQDRLNQARLIVGLTTNATDAVTVTEKTHFKQNEPVWEYVPATIVLQPMRYVYLWSPSEYWWFGNVAELQLFGWTDADTERSIPRGFIMIFR